MKTLKKLTIIVCILFFNSLIGQNDYDKIQTILAKAEEAKDSAQYDEALTWIKQAQSIHSNSPRDTLYLKINNKLIEIYNEKGRYNSSLQYCKKLLQINDKNLKLTKAYAHTLELTAKTHSLLGSIKTAVKYHKRSLELKKKLYPKNHISLADQHLIYGIELYNFTKYNLASQQFQFANDIVKNLENNVDLKLNIYTYLSNNYTYLSDTKPALKYAQLYLDLAKQEYGESSSQMATAYDNFSWIYRFNGDYKKALYYIKLTEKILLETEPDDQLKLAPVFYALSAIYNKLFEYTKAIKYYEKVILIYQADPDRFNHKLGRCYFFMGNTYRKLNQKEKAIKFMEQGKHLLINSLGKNHPDIAAMNTGIASCMDIEKNSEQALNYYKKALSIYAKANTSYLEAKTFCHVSISTIYRNTKRFKKALIHDHKMQQLYAFDKFNDGYINALNLKAQDYLSLNQLDSVSYYLNLIPKFLRFNEKGTPYQFNTVRHFEEFSKYLECKIQYNKSRYTQSNDKVYLDSIHHEIQKFIAAQEYWGDKNSTSGDKVFRLTDNLPVYENCINTYVNHKNILDPTLAFIIAEKTKSRLLKINLNAIDASNFSKVPDSLITKDVNLKKSIAKYEKLKFESEKDSIIKSCTDQLFKLNRQKDELYDVFIKEYPRFHNLKYSNKVISVNSLQQKLTNNETLIEYFLGQDNIYLYTICKDQFNVISIDTPKDIEQWVMQLRNSIYNFDNKEQTKQYLASAHHLYNTLIAPIKKELKQKLIIIPDGILNYIPFETLLEEKLDQITSYKELPYLIKNHQISYNYSATLYHQLLTQKSKAARENLIAFAPSFKDNKKQFKSISERRNGLENLLYNIPEAKMAHEYISGSLFTGANATEENFLKNAGNFKIIHLSTHAKSNDKLGDYSFIAMSKVNDSIDDVNRIYTSELYNLDLKADMVVLSACETGLGELQKGEGIISLARAFTYAGAKSTINSLWSVNDASTKTLMEEFYKNIKAGKTKDQALHEAKLSYLENEDMDAPYFWASFIAMGNMEPITLSSGFNYWWLLIIPVLFGILFFAKRKR